MSVISLLIISLVIFVASGQNCSEGWARVLGRCYLLIEEKVTFREAQSACISMGAEVATIKSRLQNEHVTDLVFNKWAKNVDVWLGGRRVHSFLNNDSHFWVWTDFTEIQYFNWAPGQPNLNGAQYCIEMVRLHKVYYKWPAGTWNDINCNEQNAVLCMASGPVTHPSPPNLTNWSHETKDTIYSSPLLKVILALVGILFVLSFALFISRNYYLNFKLRFEKPKPNFGFRIDNDKCVSTDKLSFANMSHNSPSHHLSINSNPDDSD